MRYAVCEADEESGAGASELNGRAANSVSIPNLWLVGARNLRRLRPDVFGAAAEWCYLGVDVSRRRKAGHRLSHIQRVSIGEELNRVAHDIRQRVLDWMGVIAVHQRNRLNWWASTMSSRSPLQTDFFLLMCYAELVRGWIRDDRRNVTRIVVVEDPWLLLVRADVATLGESQAGEGQP